jgi:hypothetical protein
MMGTNYYVHLKHCPQCNRYEERHVGKSSFGWQFTFRGYRAEDGQVPPIQSADDWRVVISNEGLVWDEYGAPMTAAEFWQMVERKRDGKSHYAECAKEYKSPSAVWLDPAGHNFIATEFS